MTNIIIYVIIFSAAITKRIRILYVIAYGYGRSYPCFFLGSFIDRLVTAGVYLIIRFNRLIITNRLNFYVLFISIFTIIMSGINALRECDLKTIIAPILSQLALIMMILRMGFRILGFYHLMTRAIFRSLLFLCAGIISLLVKNNQDVWCCGGLRGIIPL